MIGAHCWYIHDSKISTISTAKDIILSFDLMFKICDIKNE